MACDCAPPARVPASIGADSSLSGPFISVEVDAFGIELDVLAAHDVDVLAIDRDAAVFLHDQHAVADDQFDRLAGLEFEALARPSPTCSGRSAELAEPRSPSRRRR